MHLVYLLKSKQWVSRLCFNNCVFKNCNSILASGQRLWCWNKMMNNHHHRNTLTATQNLSLCPKTRNHVRMKCNKVYKIICRKPVQSWIAKKKQHRNGLQTANADNQHRNMKCATPEFLIWYTLTLHTWKITWDIECKRQHMFSRFIHFRVFIWYILSVRSVDTYSSIIRTAHFTEVAILVLFFDALPHKCK